MYIAHSLGILATINGIAKWQSDTPEIFAPNFYRSTKALITFYFSQQRHWLCFRSQVPPWNFSHVDTRASSWLFHVADILHDSASYIISKNKICDLPLPKQNLWPSIVKQNGGLKNWVFILAHCLSGASWKSIEFTLVSRIQTIAARLGNR